MKAPVGAAVAAVAESDTKAKEELQNPLEAAQGQANAAVGAAVGAAAGAVEKRKEQFAAQEKAVRGQLQAVSGKITDKAGEVSGAVTGFQNSLTSLLGSFGNLKEQATTPAGMFALASGQTQPVLQGQQRTPISSTRK